MTLSRVWKLRGITFTSSNAPVSGSLSNGGPAVPLIETLTRILTKLCIDYPTVTPAADLFFAAFGRKPGRSGLAGLYNLLIPLRKHLADLGEDGLLPQRKKGYLLSACEKLIEDPSQLENRLDGAALMSESLRVSQAYSLTVIEAESPLEAQSEHVEFLPLRLKNHIRTLIVIGPDGHVAGAILRNVVDRLFDLFPDIADDKVEEIMGHLWIVATAQVDRIATYAFDVNDSAAARYFQYCPQDDAAMLFARKTTAQVYANKILQKVPTGCPLRPDPNHPIVFCGPGVNQDEVYSSMESAFLAESDDALVDRKRRWIKHWFSRLPRIPRQPRMPPQREINAYVGSGGYLRRRLLGERLRRRR